MLGIFQVLDIIEWPHATSTHLVGLVVLPLLTAAGRGGLRCERQRGLLLLRPQRGFRDGEGQGISRLLSADRQILSAASRRLQPSTHKSNRAACKTSICYKVHDAKPEVYVGAQ